MRGLPDTTRGKFKDRVERSDAGFKLRRKPRTLRLQPAAPPAPTRFLRAEATPVRATAKFVPYIHR